MSVGVSTAGADPDVVCARAVIVWNDLLDDQCFCVGVWKDLDVIGGRRISHCGKSSEGVGTGYGE